MFCPQIRERESDQRIELLLATQLGNERAELLDRRRVFIQLDEGEPALQPDPATELRVVSKLVCACVQVDHGAARPAAARAIGCIQ